MKEKITRKELQSRALQLEMKIANCVNEKERETLEIELYQIQRQLLKMNKSFADEIPNDESKEM